MNENCQSVVPELVQEECGGCYTQTKCITIPSNIDFINVKAGDNLQEFINALMLKIITQDNRITVLEQYILNN